MKRPLLTLSAVAALASSAAAATPELRGTWVTTTGLTAATSTIYSRTTTAQNFTALRGIGLNTVYMDAWRNGESYFTSNALAAITGHSLSTSLSSRGDLFAETLIQSHRNGMSQYAWMQYGFASEFQTQSNALSVYMKNNGWLLKNSAGQYVDSTNKYTWMNPLVPQVRALMINMGVELATKYDLDGIQWDDRLAWPTQFGYDDYTKNAYLAETGKALPASPTDAAFTAWRASKITAFAQDFSTAIHQANPNIKFAAAPGGYGDALTSYSVDMPAWSNSTITVNGVTRPTFDEITPQIYSSLPSNFTAVLANDVNAMKYPTSTLYGVGISINKGDGTTYEWSSSSAINKDEVNSQRANTKTNGHIWWYSPGVLTDISQLTAYYNVAANGQADRPDRPADYRPAPIVATAAGTGVWNATLTTAAERYEVIARTGDAWSIVTNTVLPAGTMTLSTGGTYASVELLVDRRGFIPGDVNFDNAVNFDDLLALAQNYNQSGKGWLQGDFNLDGTVNFEDLIILAQHYNTGVPANEQMSFADALALVQSQLPEPGTLSAAIAVVGFATRRTRRPVSS